MTSDFDPDRFIRVRASVIENGEARIKELEAELANVKEMARAFFNEGVQIKSQVHELETRIKELEHDIHAYRGALGYAVPGNHNGKLSDGTGPKCGMCDANYKRAERLEVELAVEKDHNGFLRRKLTYAAQEKVKREMDIHRINKLESALSDMSAENATLQANIRELEAELAKWKKRVAWQRCDKHGDIDGNRAWGCPDCVDELRRDNSRLRSCLKRLEWITRFDPDYAGRRYCPCCFYTIDHGHDPACWLAAEIRGV